LGSACSASAVVIAARAVAHVLPSYASIIDAVKQYLHVPSLHTADSVPPAAKLGNVKENLNLLKVFNMVQAFIAASVRGLVAQQ
jgi:hypothetical protein